MSEDPRQMLQELLQHLDSIKASDLHKEIIAAIRQTVLTSNEEKIEGRKETVTRERPLTPEEQYLAAARLVHERLMLPKIASIVRESMNDKTVLIANDNTELPGNGSLPLFWMSVDSTPDPTIPEWLSNTHFSAAEPEQLDEIGDLIDQLTSSTSGALL